jgi:predicted phage terminase large subunit-like protein
MFSRLRKLKKLEGVPLRFRCASNPPRREQLERGEYIKRRYVDKKTRGKRAFIPAWIDDNPYLNKKTYLLSLAELDSITRMQLEEGNWEVRAKGNLFDRSDFVIVDHTPSDIYWVRYWDLAATEPSKENKTPARSAGCKMGVTRDKKIYIADIRKFQKNPAGTEREVKQTAKIDGIEVEIYMEQEPGSGGKNTISHYRRNVLFGYAFTGNTVSGKGDKIQRANPLSTQVEAHNVYLVNGPWVPEFFDEAELFPNSKFKDQVDAASGAYQMLAGPLVKPRLTII